MPSRYPDAGLELQVALGTTSAAIAGLAELAGPGDIIGQREPQARRSPARARTPLRPDASASADDPATAVSIRPSWQTGAAVFPRFEERPFRSTD